MMGWLNQYAGAVSILLTLGVVVLWPALTLLIRARLASRQQLDDERSARAAADDRIEKRLADVELQVRALPTRDDLARLHDDIASLDRNLSAATAQLTTLMRTVETHTSVFLDAASARRRSSGGDK